MQPMTLTLADVAMLRLAVQYYLAATRRRWGAEDRDVQNAEAFLAKSQAWVDTLTKETHEAPKGGPPPLDVAWEIPMRLGNRDYLRIK